MSVSEQRVTQALTYRAETDEPCAAAKALMKGLEHQLKTIEAIEFLKIEGPQGLREKGARASIAYRAHLEKLENATYEYEALNNKRMSEAILIEVFRSLNANRRQGNI